MLEALEELHRPARGPHDWVSPECHGCDSDGFDTEYPQWPCRTAQLIWPDPDEQAAVLADWQEWADAARASARRTHTASPTARFIPDIWANQITEAMHRPTIGILSVSLRLR